jgi:hypothetical protein
MTSSIEQILTQRAAHAQDALQDHEENADPGSIDELREMFPLTTSSIVSQWIAGFQIKTNFDLMKASISAIR